MRLLNRTMVAGMVAAAAATVSGAAAFGCTALATIDAQAAAAPVGTAVAVTGASFSTAAGASPVVFHWGGATGAEVARATPDAAGNVTATFTVPQADAGYHTLVATQQDAKGEAVYGTPARYSFQVLGPDGQAPAAPSAAPVPPATPTSSDSGGVVALTLVLGAAGLTLFGAGAATVVRQGRQAKPTAAPVRHD
ncbi:MAG TPA: hypothetical protein VM264_00380 [Acidimicrobiales bacterium]|nr:hypothetical protein [Acidimicrobiales bacterium]